MLGGINYPPSKFQVNPLLKKRCIYTWKFKKVIVYLFLYIRKGQAYLSSRGFNKLFDSADFNKGNRQEKACGGSRPVATANLIMIIWKMLKSLN